MSKKKIFQSEQEVSALLNNVRIGKYGLTDDQKKGLMKLYTWMTWAHEDAKKNPVNPPIFRLFGLAGCGKTSMAVSIKAMGLRPLYVSFTNRAVGVLGAKGCVPCRTVHSVIYMTYDDMTGPSPEDEKILQAYRLAELAGVPIEERPALPPVRGKVGYELRTFSEIQSEVQGHDCIVVDEASMIGHTMGQDLKKIGLPIIGVGDPGQLPPVGDYPFFDPKSPDVLLTQVLRTDGDILDAAAFVRRGGLFGDLPQGKDYEVLRKAPREWFEQADQVLCGIHHKRRELNRHIRELKGFTGIEPQVGEKICVASNNKYLGVSNGSLWTITKSVRQGDWMVLDLLEYSPNTPLERLERVPEVRVHMACFLQDIKSSQDIDIRGTPETVVATWGYAITVHKAQGSEWNNVLIFDDSKVFGEHARKWAYTAVTRAAKKAMIVTRNGGKNV